MNVSDELPNSLSHSATSVTDSCELSSKDESQLWHEVGTWELIRPQLERGRGGGLLLSDTYSNTFKNICLAL